MSNVYVENIGVPKKYRNKRIYGGNSFDSTNPRQSSDKYIKHWEHGKLVDLASKTVIVYFNTEFTNSPVPINLKVYRMVENIPIAGKWIKQDVLHYFDDDEDWYVKTGFSLFIDESEDLEGVIIEYCFTE